jgi:hypothetical protein
MVVLIEFESPLPDDGTWTETNEILAPSGHNVAEAIVEHLDRQGVLSSRIEQHSYYGWCWVSGIANVPLSMLIQRADECILQIKDDRGLFARAVGKREFITALGEGQRMLSSLDRLDSASWYDRDLYNRYGPSDDARLKFLA